MSFDFASSGPTRGLLNPPLGPDGRVFQPRPAPRTRSAERSIVEVRERLGLTVAELAAVLCVSERTVWRWQQGCRVPPPMQRFMELLVEGGIKITKRGVAAHARGPTP